MHNDKRYACGRRYKQLVPLQKYVSCQVPSVPRPEAQASPTVGEAQSPIFPSYVAREYNSHLGLQLGSFNISIKICFPLTKPKWEKLPSFSQDQNRESIRLLLVPGRVLRQLYTLPCHFAQQEIYQKYSKLAHNYSNLQLITLQLV